MGEFLLDNDGTMTVLNDTDIDNETVFRALAHQSPEIAAMVRWTSDTQLPASRRGGLFERDRYVTPNSIFEQFKTAQHAAENDDVVAGVLETTEALAFGKMSIDTEDEDETDVWNQIAAEIDLDSRLREMWRETFTVSQIYAAVYWGTRSYKVRGKSKTGVARKKSFSDLRVPLGVTLLDPLKIVPVGNFLFNQDALAYAADKGGEYDVIQAVIDGERELDPIMAQLIHGRYEPDVTERRQLQEEGLPADRLFLLNPRNVWRHTETRPQYQRFANVRMKSVFELLDLKTQLRQMDRAHLLGSTNFIILIKKGTDAQPAKPAEVMNLQAQVRTLARVPVIVGDHRLAIEIVTPKTDKTLEPERYNGIDARITARLYSMFMTGNFAAGAKGDSSIDLAKMVGRGLESRRHMLRRSLEANVFKRIYDLNDQLTEEPKLQFHPKRIALDFDPTFANFLLDLRDRGDLSRESILEEIDYDQYTEFRRRKVEKDRYDDTFETVVPYTAPKATPSPVKQRGGPGAVDTGKPAVDPKAAGRRQGGTRNGGGAAPGTGQGKAPVNPAKKSK